METSEKLTKDVEEDKEKSSVTRMLDSLYFAQLEDRESRISKAHVSTYRWIFERHKHDAYSSTSFVNWLEDYGKQKGVFWIAGTAGSGKSTLMKYLVHEPKTKQHLQLWAGSRTPVIASCFFWNPGNAMQKSLTGLLRSLLHQLLRQRPSLIPRVAPWRWRSYLLGATALDSWSEPELLKSFRTLILEAADSNMICLFIDGLDEFHGSDSKRAEIISHFAGISESRHIKVCMSSRPWNVFKDTFDSCPKLLLEDLTYRDIENYVEAKLRENARFARLRHDNPCGSSELVSNIVSKARGVFLWVVLVVRSLLEGVMDGMASQILPGDFR